jgi:DNA polymerase-1
MILFSKFYGGGLDKIAFLIRCDRKQAAEFVNDFDNRLPGVNRYIKRLSNKVRREGLLINLFGREYPIEPNFAYRGVNYMIQGSAAEVIKRAMIRIADIHPKLRMMGQLHDELFLELPERLHSKSLMREIQSAAQADSSKCGIPVPLPIGFKMTKTNWSEAKEVEL